MSGDRKMWPKLPIPLAPVLPSLIDRPTPTSKWLQFRPPTRTSQNSCRVGFCFDSFLYLLDFFLDLQRTFFNIPQPLSTFSKVCHLPIHPIRAISVIPAEFFHKIIVTNQKVSLDVLSRY
jgi:hypothetical protein